MPFLHKNSSNINFLAAENCTSNGAENIIKEIHTVTNIYKASGLNMDVYHEDNEFNINPFREHIRPEILNICAKGRHIPSIDKSIQTIKQGARCTKHPFPYKRYTRLMDISLVE